MNGIALLPAPISGVVKDGGPVYVIGFTHVKALVVNDEGFPLWTDLPDLRLDWRYSWKTNTWIDVGPYEELDESEEEADDGGEEIPGDIPDADRTSGGNQSDGEDGAARGLDSGEARGTE